MPTPATVIEDWKKRTASLTTEGKQARRVFDVVFDGSVDPEMAPAWAVDSTGVPRLYSSHPANRWLYVVDVTANPDGPLKFEVVVTYGTVRNDQQYTYSGGDPLSVPPEVEWLHTNGSGPIDVDINGDPITNSADEPYDPAMMKDHSDLVLRYVRNESFFNYIAAASYINKVNDDIFLDFERGVVRCTVLSARKMHVAGFTYWRVTYEFQIRFDGWHMRQRDAGYREVTATGYAEITDDNDNKVTLPVELNGSGNKLPAGDPVVFLDYYIYDFALFNDFNIVV